MNSNTNTMLNEHSITSPDSQFILEPLQTAPWSKGSGTDLFLKGSYKSKQFGTVTDDDFNIQ